MRATILDDSDCAVHNAPALTVGTCDCRSGGIALERERCAQIAEHLNGWGHPPAPELAAHIARIIRNQS